MENPRPEKVAVVEEVRDKFASSEAVVFTEYRGLTVRDLQELRAALRPAGGEYKVYKNTLVRRATEDLDLGDTLTGPTALTFVGPRPDGTPGDAVLVAKAIRAFAKSNPKLVVKGGRLGEQMLDEAGVTALASVAPREELLARLAGAMAAPMTSFARLLQAVPQRFAYAVQALIDQGGVAAPEPVSAEDTATDEQQTQTEESAEEAEDASGDGAGGTDAAGAEDAAEESE